MSSFVRLSSLHRLSRSWPKAAGAVAAPRPASSVAFSLARPYSAAAVTENTDAHTAGSEFYIQGRPSTSSHGIPVNSNWKAIEDQPLTGKSVHDLLENAIPAVRHQNFLSKEECSKLVDIIQEHGIGSYNQGVVFPPLGSVGISQFDLDKEAYLSGVDAASSLQKRFKQEAGVDVVGRVAAVLQEATGIETRVAREDGRPYFAGMLRVVSNYIQIHSDYGPYDGPDWEIGHVTGQLSWNVLLRKVHGGDTIIYDRPWNGDADNAAFRKAFPGYAFQPSAVQGRICKALRAIEGDLTFFNSSPVI
ncbi:putative signal transduction protein [Eutypa lata UCREL1]|uniref:Putative signal transduction protein n=1 Tax=Eutypa lata (strain UCR-EL1) TaxID=1287681 RepID=M7T3A1_EUTLA|nr:putative signal transduction protein [Eutypa lata UCREL1]